MRAILTPFLILVLSGAAFAQPANDDCRNAERIEQGVTPWDTTGATTDGPQEFTCGFCCGDEQINQDIWYEFVSDVTGPIVVSLCGSSFDTKLAVYEENCPVAPGEIIACNDDFPGCELQSRVTIDTVEGTTYLIRIGGFREAVGPGTLSVAPPPPAPDNDECPDAIEVRTGEVFRGDTTGATGEDVTSCAGNDILDVWHTWVADCTGLARISLCDSAFDTTLAVFDQCDGAEQACDDDSCDRNALIELPVTDGTEYVIRVAGFNGLSGPYALEVSCTPNDRGACCEPDGGCSFGTEQDCRDAGGTYFPARTCDQVECPPANDDCANAIEIFDGSTDYDNLGATTDGPPHPLCDFAQFDQVDGDVWFSYRATGDGEVIISTCNQADYDTKMAAYGGLECPVNDERILACNDDAEGCGLTSVISFEAVCGQDYLIRVGGFRDARGTGTLTITPSGPCEPPVACNKIRKFKAACGNGKLKVVVKSRLEPGTMLTIDNNGDRGVMRINNKGKGKVKFTRQSGMHTVFITECPERTKDLDCG